MNYLYDGVLWVGSYQIQQRMIDQLNPENSSFVSLNSLYFDFCNTRIGHKTHKVIRIMEKLS